MKPIFAIALSVLVVGPASAARPGQAVMAWPVTIAPTWSDPSTSPPQITPFGILYAIHVAMVRPLPNQKTFPSYEDKRIKD